MFVGCKVEYLPLQSLKQNPKNARTHPKKQLRQLTASIRHFGFNNPIVVDENNMILAGHGRAAAARQLSLPEVPCIRLEHMSAADKRAYSLADNKLALNAGWDEELLAEELQALIQIDPEFDFALTGFTIAEMDGLIEELVLEESGDPKDDRLPKLGEASRVKEGDIWRLGSHRLICGSCLETDVLDALMDGEMWKRTFGLLTQITPSGLATTDLCQCLWRRLIVALTPSYSGSCCTMWIRSKAFLSAFSISS